MGGEHTDADGGPDAARIASRSGARGRRGFTLLEVLLVLALIGLLASVLVGGAAQLLNNKPMSADDVFWNAVEEARKMALKSDGDAVLTYQDDQEKGKAFVVTGASGSKSFPIPKPGDLEVTFLSGQKGGNLIMVGGTVLETQKIPSVTFYADGTCTPFRVQFFRNGATHAAQIDPWTCAPMLTPSDSTGSLPNS